MENTRNEEYFTPPDTKTLNSTCVTSQVSWKAKQPPTRGNPCKHFPAKSRAPRIPRALRKYWLTSENALEGLR